MKSKSTAQRHTYPVSNEVFQQVYDSPASLPGKHKWVTKDADVRQIEELLHMPAHTIGAPLWLSGDRKRCPKCRRETSWLDIVGSALKKVHGKEMIRTSLTLLILMSRSLLAGTLIMQLMK